MSEPDTGTAGSGGGGTSGSTATPPETDEDADTPEPDGGSDAGDGGDAGDAGQSQDASSGPPPFNETNACAQKVAAFADVALWLNGDEGVMADGLGQVQSWEDRSIHGHRALPDLVQGAEAYPLRVTPDAVGHSGVQFGATQVNAREVVRRLRIEDHPALQFGTNDFGLVAVLRHRNDLSGPHEIGLIYLKMCFDCYFGPGPVLFANDNWAYFDSMPTQSGFTIQTAGTPEQAVRAAQTGFNDNHLHVVVATRRGSRLDLRVDRNPVSSFKDLGAFNVSAVGWDAYMGANPNNEIPQQALDGEIFELIALTGAALDDLDELVDCLAESYAID